MKYINRLASNFAKLAQEAELSPEEVQNRLIGFKLEEAVEKSKTPLMEFLGLTNASDLQLKCEYLPQSKRGRCILSFSPAVKAQINQRVEDNKKLSPSFSLGNFTKQLIERYSFGKIPVDVMIV
jgi:hypothetical protein